LSEERDLRAYAKTTQIHLILGVILLLFIVGDGIVYVIFGAEAGKFAFLCTGLGLLPLILIFGSLWFLGWIARRARCE
jgi:hypothetical protein